MRASAAVFIITASSYVALVLGVLRGIFIMRYVSVTGRGLMQSMFIINRYTSNAHLGILHGLSKELPLKIGAHDEDGAALVEDVGMTWVIGLTTIVALGMAIWGILEPTNMRPTGQAIVIGAGWLLANQTYVLYRCVVRSWGNFKLLAYLSVVEAVVTFGLAVYGAAVWGFRGAMLGMLLGWIVDLVLLHMYSGVRIRVRWDPAVAFSLLKMGLPILLITLSDTLLRTVDGAIVVKYYAAYYFGLYSVGMQVAGYMFAIPESAGFVIWPKIIEAWGAHGDVHEMRRHIELPTIAAASIMPLLAGIAHTVLPPATYMIVPRFAESVNAAQILCWGGIFLALPLATNSMLVATNRENVVIAIKTGAGLLLAAATYWLVRHEYPIEHIAIAASGAYAVASLASLMAVFPYYYRGIELVKELFACYVPVLWAIVSLRLAAHFAALFVSPSEGDFLFASLYMVAFIALYAPAMVYANYHKALLHEVLEYRRSKMKGSVTPHSNDKDE